MMQLVIKNFDNEDIGNFDLNESVFNAPTDRTDILHRVVQWQLAKARSGCHKVKGRSEVHGTTKKVYKQKGTGQARHGAKTAPIFRGGGITFGPHVRDHGYKLNKKVRKLGLKVALSLKHANNSIIVLNSMELNEIKSSLLSEKLNKFNINKSVLIVDTQLNENLIKSSANLKHVNVLLVRGLNVRDILKHEKIMISQSAIYAIQERLA